MILPPSIKVLGFDWEVMYSRDVTYEANAYGTTHHSSQKLFIDPTTSEQKKAQTLLHELMHAIWWQTGLGKRYDKDHPKIEEEVVHTLSMGLYQVLKDNNISFS